MKDGLGGAIRTLRVNQHATVVLMSEGNKGPSPVSEIVEKNFQAAFMVHLASNADAGQALIETFESFHKLPRVQQATHQGIYLTAIFINGDHVTTALAGGDEAFIRRAGEQGRLEPITQAVYPTDRGENARLMEIIQEEQELTGKTGSSIRPDTGTIDGNRLYSARGVGNFPTITENLVVPAPVIQETTVHQGDLLVLGSRDLWLAATDDGTPAHTDVKDILSQKSNRVVAK